MIKDLADIVADVCSYFVHKIPTEQTMEQWAEKLQGLNLRASRGWVVKIISNGEKFPSNFPAAVKFAYSSWLRNQPKAHDQKGCAYCLDGLIHAREKRGNVFAFRCGHCNISEADYPVATRYSLAEKGFELDWPHDYHGPVNKALVGKVLGLKLDTAKAIPF